ncbi:hypothetical protein V6N11_068834 [Hibiscus sabdariffa]|uniref:Uncharacterized protein n=1 Tax=Hibiscus sabdariffa TaxID=183260 RepID=A0ABR2PAX0_9ROSI
MSSLLASVTHFHSCPWSHDHVSKFCHPRIWPPSKSIVLSFAVIRALFCHLLSFLNWQAVFDVSGFDGLGSRTESMK